MLKKGVWGRTFKDKASDARSASGAKTLPSTVPVILIQGLLNQVLANQKLSFSLQWSVNYVKFPPFDNFSR